MLRVHKFILFLVKKSKFYSQKIICFILFISNLIENKNKQNYSFEVLTLQLSRVMSMTEQITHDEVQPVNYLNGLLEKNSKASSRAQQYVALKNVEISQKLINGQELIASEQAEIKTLKNQSEQEKKKAKQVSSEKNILEKKVLMISSENANQSEPKSPPKQLTEEQRLKFVKQKIKENKLIQKRKQDQLKKLQEKQKLQKQQQEQQKAKKQEQAKQKRLEQTKLKLEEIEKRKQQRVLQNKKTNEILKEKSKQKILADKIQQKYISHQNLMLDEKKKKLAEIRQLYKPIDRKQLDEHMKKIDEQKLERSRNKQVNKSNLNSSSQKINQYYRSMFHQILEKEKRLKHQEEIQHEYKIKELKQKGKKYAEEIKVSFKPEIDLKKREEIEKRIKSSSLIGKDIDTKLKGIQYLQFAKEYGQKFKKEPDQTPVNQVLMRQQANKTQHTDYLQEIRKQNGQSRLKRSATSAQDFIKKVEKKNISHRQKQEEIIQFAEDLERKAKAKQKITKISYAENIDEEVDKLYISAIEAKIKALQV